MQILYHYVWLIIVDYTTVGLIMLILTLSMAVWGTCAWVVVEYDVVDVMYSIVMWFWHDDDVEK